MRRVVRALAIVATGAGAFVSGAPALAGPETGTIRVRIDGMTAEELEEATVEVVTRSRRFRNDRLPLLRTEGGWFVASTAAFARANETDDCELVVDHPDHEAERRPLLMPRRSDGTVPPSVTRIDTVRLLRATVVAGRVVDRFPVEARVAAASYGALDLARSVTTDSSGFYRLKVVGPGAVPGSVVEVVAIPSLLRSPVSARVAIAAGGVTRAPDFVIDELCVLGRADVEGVDHDKTWIHATWLGEAPARTHLEFVGYVRSRWQRVRSLGGPTATGRFGIAGLAPGPWRLSLVTKEFERNVHPDLLVARTAIVSIPCDSIRIGAPTRSVAWTVTGPDGAIDDAVIAVHGVTGRLLVRTGADGRADARVRADRDVDFTVAAQGYATHDDVILAGCDEERAIHLEHAGTWRPWFPRSADLGPRVRVVGTDGQPLSARARIVDDRGVRVNARFLEPIDDDAWIEWHRMLSPRSAVFVGGDGWPGKTLDVGGEGFTRASLALPLAEPWDIPDAVLHAR